MQKNMRQPQRFLFFVVLISLDLFICYFVLLFFLSLFLPIFNFICGCDLGKGGNYYIGGKESTIVAENGAVHLTAYANLRVCLTGFP